MKRPSASGPADLPDAFRALAEDGDRWLADVRAAESARAASRIGAYEILGEARGGQGLVFRARQPRTGREVALKRLALGTLSSAAERRRFEREIEVAAQLSHPGIVTVHGVELVDDVPLLAMEWVEGEEITAWARRVPPGRAGVRRKLALLLAVCDAVEHAHASGVIHRDLKPSNVLVDRSGAPRVLDFGLARRVDGPEDLEPTRTLGFVGTPAYAPPERFTQGAAPADARGDVWSLGVVLFEMLAGRRPFEAEGFAALARAIAEDPPPRASALAEGVGRELDTILGKALAKAPAVRYATVHALASDLRRHLEGRPVLAMPPRATYLIGTWVRRHRVESALAAALLVVVAAAAAFGVRQAGLLAAARDRAQEQARRAERSAALADAEAGRARAAQAEAETMAARQLRAREYYMDMLFLPYYEGDQAQRDAALASMQHAAAQAPEYFKDHPHLAVEAITKIAKAVIQGSPGGAGLELAESAHALGRTLSDQFAGIRAEAAGAVAMAEFLNGDYARAREHAEVAVDLFELSSVDPPEGIHAEALHYLAASEASLGDLASAETHFLKALEVLGGVSERLQFHDVVEIQVRVLYGGVLIRLGRLEEAQASLEVAWELGVREGLEGLLVVYGVTEKRVDVLGRRGRLDRMPGVYEHGFAVTAGSLPDGLEPLTTHAMGTARWIAGQEATAAEYGIADVMYGLVLEHGVGEGNLRAAREEREALRARAEF